jgi:WD40 repeat protein
VGKIGTGDARYDRGFSPDGKFFALIGENGATRLYETTTFAEIGRLQGQFHMSVGFSTDGRRFATGGNGNEAVNIWDAAGRMVLLSLETKGSLHRPTVFSPDGNLLASSTSAGVVDLPQGGIVRIWRAPSWERIKAAERAEGRAEPRDSSTQ